jgi:hypothetical protein
MALGNGQAPSLQDQRARYEMLRMAPEPRQESSPGGLSVTRGIGLRAPFAEQVPEFVQPYTPRPGVIDAFVKTCQRWGLNDKQQIILLGYADNEFLGSELLKGRWLRPSQDVKDRAGYVLGISVGLGALFDESVEAEVSWLNTPHPKLRGVTPLALMLGGRMASLMTVAQVVAEARELY